MANLILYLRVPPLDAMRIGGTIAGDLETELTAEQVKQIGREGWIDLIAPYVDTGEAVLSRARGDEFRLEVRDATWPEVVRALEGLRVERDQSAELAASAHRSGLAVMRALGQGDQLARFEAGALPQDELIAVVRELAFSPFSDLPRYHNKFLTAANLTHRFGCNRHNAGAVPHLKGKPKIQLSSAEWERAHALRELAKAVPEAWARAVNEPGFPIPTITAVEHTVECPACLASHSVTSFKVTAKWYGHELTREYMP